MADVNIDPGVLVHLPSRLHFVIAPALKYGRHQFAADVRAFADRVSDAERDELRGVREKMSDDDYEEVEWFFDNYSITKHVESARLFYLWSVIDAVLGELPSKQLTRDEKALESLKGLRGFGSPRLAARRMWAARWFFENPPIPVNAVETLRVACTDESPHVRIWAHGAMALHDGNVKEHVRSIDAVVDSVPQDDDNRSFVLGDAEKIIQSLIPEEPM